MSILYDIISIKNDLVHAYTGLYLYTPVEVAHLTGLAPKAQEHLLSCMHYALARHKTDAAICPSCHAAASDCSTCNYAKTHGICGHWDSTYVKVRKELRKYGMEFIHEIPGMVPAITAYLNKWSTLPKTATLSDLSNAKEDFSILYDNLPIYADQLDIDLDQRVINIHKRNTKE